MEETTYIQLTQAVKGTPLLLNLAFFHSAVKGTGNYTDVLCTKGNGATELITYSVTESVQDIINIIDENIIVL